MAFVTEYANQAGRDVIQHEGKAVKMELLRCPQVSTILLLAALAGCTQPQNSQDLKEKTAQATAEVKRDAKAVAAGNREGLRRANPITFKTPTNEHSHNLT